MKRQEHKRVCRRDMKDSFGQLAEYQGKTEHLIDARFDKIEERLNNIETTMATKEDITEIRSTMAAMEARILDAFRQLLTTISPQNEK